MRKDFCMQNLFLYLSAKGVPVKHIAFSKSAAVQNCSVIPFYLFCRRTAVVAAVRTSYTNTVCSNRQQNLWIVLLKMQQRFCHMFGEVGTVTMSAKKAGTKPVVRSKFIRLHFLFLWQRPDKRTVLATALQ